MLQHRRTRHPPELLLSGWLLAPSTDVLLDSLLLLAFPMLSHCEVVQRGLDQMANRRAPIRVALDESLVKLANERCRERDRDAGSLRRWRTLHVTIIAPPGGHEPGLSQSEEA